MFVLAVNIPPDKRSAVNDEIFKSVEYVIFSVFLDSSDVEVFCMNFPRSYPYSINTKPALIFGPRIEENDTEEIMEKFMQNLKDSIMQATEIDLEIFGFDFRSTNNDDFASEIQEITYHFDVYHVD